MNRSLKIRNSQRAESSATKSHIVFENASPAQQSPSENPDIELKKTDGFVYPLNFDQDSETNVIFFAGILLGAAILVLALLWKFS